MELIHALVRLPLLALLVGAYAVTRGEQRSLIAADVERWREVFNWPRSGTVRTLARLGRGKTREFRNLFYYRLSKGPKPTKVAGRILSAIAPGERTLFLRSREIGPGLFIQHGFATIVTATSIGANCWINQQVTVGHSGKKGSPRIGDGVRIAAGAMVIGPVTIGDGVIVGAGAVVTKDVPAGAIAVGPQATWFHPAANV